MNSLGSCRPRREEDKRWEDCRAGQAHGRDEGEEGRNTEVGAEFGTRWKSVNILLGWVYNIGVGWLEPGNSGCHFSAPDSRSVCLMHINKWQEFVFVRNYVLEVLHTAWELCIHPVSKDCSHQSRPYLPPLSHKIQQDGK